MTTSVVGSSSSQFSKVADYNEAQYKTLLQTAEAKNISADVVDAKLLDAIKSGQTFTKAVTSVASDLPTLPLPSKPGYTAMDYYQCSGLPSPGAGMMAVMIENTAEERRDNAEMRFKQTEVIVQQMENQADVMREKAALQLAMGIASGIVSIGMGVATATMSAASLKSSAKQYGEYTKGTVDGKTNSDGLVAKGKYDHIITQQQTNTAAISQFGAGMTGMLDSANTFIGTMYDAKLKEMDADIEKQRAFRDMLASLDEALSQQITKALAAMEAIQSDMNQTRTRIIG